MPTREELEVWRGELESERDEELDAWDELWRDEPLSAYELEARRQQRRELRRESDRSWGTLTWKGLPAPMLDEIGVDYRACPVKNGVIYPPPPGRALKIPYKDAQGNQFVQEPYTDEDGREHPAIPAERRFVVRGENGDWEPRWPPGYKAKEGPPFIPVGQRPLDQRSDCALLVCEGESDTIAAWIWAYGENVNVDVLGVPGMSMWRPELVEYGRGYGRVYLAGDGDETGRKLNAEMAKDLRATGLETRVVPLREGQDIRDHLEDGLFLTDLLEAADEAAEDGLIEELRTQGILGSAAPEEGLAAHVKPVVDTDPARLPALLKSENGATIIYAGKLHTLHGPPGVAKSWIALLAAKQAIRVLWWDFEDKPSTLARRAKRIGAHNILDPELTKYVGPSLFEDPVAMSEAQAWISEGNPAMNLVVIDAAEAAGCPSDGAEVGEWFRTRVRPWQDVGATVIILDHIPKRKEGRARGPIGSQHKLARVDGAAILVEGTPWTKNEPGRVHLTVDKDRPGDMPAVGQHLATVVGDYDEDDAFRLKIVAPDDEPEDDDLELAVLQAVHEHDGFDSTTKLHRSHDRPQPRRAGGRGETR